jgi:hypothetical protein
MAVSPSRSCLVKGIFSLEKDEQEGREGDNEGERMKGRERERERTDCLVITH